MKWLVMLVMACLAVSSTYAADTAYTVEDDHVRSISRDIRCMVCQGQSVYDSNAALAVEIREIIREQVVAGKDEGEIKSYLVARYGEGILYNPPLTGNTWVLWFGPVLVVMAGGAIAWQSNKRQRLL